MWDAYEEFGDRDRSTLTVEGQRLFAILDLRQEVNSGGFDVYFRYWGGDTAELALAALPHTLGQDWANLLRDAMALFGTEYPLDPDTRGDIIDSEGLDDALSALDRHFLELEARSDADRRLSVFAGDFRCGSERQED
jgi:hypothetical protein